MQSLTANLETILKHHVYSWAVCWEIERTDGVFLRFTDHDEALTIDSGAYVPAGGFNATARQKQSQLKTQNMQIVGMLTSDAIENDDLRAGRYREAKVTEHVVDWRVPWAGDLARNKYCVSETEFTEHGWTAQIQGLTRWLRSNVGDVYGRLCRWDLGDSKCTVNLAPHTLAGTVTALTTDAPRSLFDITLTAFSNDYFSNGLLIWTSGLNHDLKFEVSAYDDGGRIRLHLDCPFNIQVGDAFTVYPGCNKTKNHCKGTTGGGGRPWSNNILNHGGFPTIPGTDKMLRTPTSLN